MQIETRTKELKSRSDWDWCTSSEHTFLGISLAEEAPDVLDFIYIPPGEPAFVVWAIWSEGDSFGTAYGGYKEAFGIFPTREEAETAALWLAALRETNPKTLHHLQTSSGQRMLVREPPWLDFFCSLESVEISETKIPEGGPSLHRRRLSQLWLD